jgi:hypothetical protein
MALAFIVAMAIQMVGQQVCPVEIKSTNSNYYVDSSVDPWNSALRIEYINHAKVNTTAIRFGVYFANTMGEREKSVYYYLDSDGLKPEKLRRSNWSDGVYTQGTYSLKALAWVEKIGFADGTVWQDDGSRSCGLIAPYIAPKEYEATPKPSVPSQSIAPVISKEHELMMKNSEAGKSSEAQAATLAQMGHIPTSEEMEAAVMAGTASRCGVITTPAGASVYIDGNKGGVTPFAFVLFKHDIPRVITIKLDGYKPVERQIVPDGKTVPIIVNLVKE